MASVQCSEASKRPDAVLRLVRGLFVTALLLLGGFAQRLLIFLHGLGVLFGQFLVDLLLLLRGSFGFDPVLADAPVFTLGIGRRRAEKCHGHEQQQG